MEKIITRMILSGETLDSIYRKLNVTKKLIGEVFRSIEYSQLMDCGWDYLRIVIEKSLFSLHKKYSYQRNCAVSDFDLAFDYVLFENGIPVLCIDILGYQYMLNDDQPIIDQKEYNQRHSFLKQKDRFCSKHQIPFLELPFCEIIDYPFLADTFRSAIKSIEYAQEHNRESSEEYLDINNIGIISVENHSQIIAAKMCGCYHCGAIFNVRELDKPILYCDDESAICPYCDNDSLVSDFQGVDITPELFKTFKSAREKIEGTGDYCNYQ